MASFVIMKGIHCIAGAETTPLKKICPLYTVQYTMYWGFLIFRQQQLGVKHSSPIQLISSEAWETIYSFLTAKFQAGPKF